MAIKESIKISVMGHKQRTLQDLPISYHLLDIILSLREEIEYVDNPPFYQFREIGLNVFV